MEVSIATLPWSHTKELPWQSLSRPWHGAMQRSCPLNSLPIKTGEASKLRGQLHWTALGMTGKVGRGGLGPLIQREYTDTAPWSLSNQLKASLRYFHQLQETASPKNTDRPTRQAYVGRGN